MGGGGWPPEGIGGGRAGGIGVGRPEGILSGGMAEGIGGGRAGGNHLQPHPFTRTLHTSIQALGIRAGPGLKGGGTAICWGWGCCAGGGVAVLG
jgi:hypothetical protein